MIKLQEYTTDVLLSELRRRLHSMLGFPKIVCLCGSTRFIKEFQDANLEETLAGHIVLTVGSVTHSDKLLQHIITPEVKARLDELHKRKIDLADEVIILNVGGYIGESTRSDINYAKKKSKLIRWLEPFK